MQCNSTTPLPPLTPEQQATEDRQLALHAKLRAEADAMEKADREANGGKPVTRVIDGVTYYKSYGYGCPLNGEPSVEIAWIPDCVVTGEFEPVQAS